MSPHAPRSVTRLSRRFGSVLRAFELSRLARPSLGLLCVAMSGCLIDDPPPYPVATQTSPQLAYHDALPLLDQVIVAKTNDIIDFTIPVTSEDAGDTLHAFLLLDYAGGPSLSLDATSLAPSTFDQGPREITLKWIVGLGMGADFKAGCHRLTLRVSHQLNIDINRVPEVFDAGDLAEAYWWANVNADPASGNTLVDCPLASRGKQ